MNKEERKLIKSYAGQFDLFTQNLIEANALSKVLVTNVSALNDWIRDEMDGYITAISITTSRIENKMDDIPVAFPNEVLDLERSITEMKERMKKIQKAINALGGGPRFVQSQEITGGPTIDFADNTIKIPDISNSFEQRTVANVPNELVNLLSDLERKIDIVDSRLNISKKEKSKGEVILTYFGFGRLKINS